MDPNELDDPELQKALQMSLLDQEEMQGSACEEDIKKALQLSQSTTYGTSPVFSQEDQTINRAIEESLKETTRANAFTDVPSDDPSLMLRQDQTPVGLKNVGNTCYLNSLLQTYVRIPPLLNSIFNYPTQLELENTEKDSCKATFMKQLRLCLGLILFSNRKFIDPTPLLNSLRDKSGTMIITGNNEDVSEFNDFFLSWMADALSLACEKGEENTVKKLFFGEAVQILQAYEVDGKLISTESKELFSHILLPVTESIPRFYECLDLFFEDVMDYTTESGHRTEACKSMWIDSLPPILCFQENRVRFNQEERSFEKVNQPLVFPLKLFMDRYLLKNKEKTLEKRKEAKSRKEELVGIQDRLKELVQYGKDKLNLPSALETSALYLESQKQAASSRSKHLEECVKMLRDFSYTLREEEDALREKESAIQVWADQLFDSLNSTPYRLFAVWVHGGNTCTGHFWSFFATADPATWIKCNDVRVTEVDESVMMSEAVGSPSSSTSASFLIYLREDLFQEAVSPSVSLDTVPPSLKDYVQEENERLIKAIARQEDMKKMRAEVHNLVEECDKSYMSMQTTLLGHPAWSRGYISHFAFLARSGIEQPLKAQVLVDCYPKVLGCVISAEDEVNQLRRRIVSERVGETLVQLAVMIEVEGIGDEYKKEYHHFLMGAYHYCEGLYLLAKENPLVALNQFMAHLHFEQDQTPPARASFHTLPFIRIVAMFYIEYGFNLLGRLDPGGLKVLHGLTSMLRYLNENDPLIPAVRKVFYQRLDMLAHLNLRKEVIQRLEIVQEDLLRIGMVANERPSKDAIPPFPRVSEADCQERLLRVPDLQADWVGRHKEFYEKILNIYPSFADA